MAMSINSDTVYVLLARCLPRRVARRAADALGRAAGGVPGAARRHALARLRMVFPELEAKPLASLARSASGHRAAAIVDGVAAGRLDARALCRRLSLFGWHHLDAAESRERGVVVLSAGVGCWQLASLAVALYRGPIDAFDDWHADRVLRTLAAKLEYRSDTRLIRAFAEPGVAPGIRAGARLGVLADRPAGAGEAVDVPFLGRALRARTWVARAALASGAPLVPVFGYPGPRGWRVEARPPIEPEGDVETLTARCVETAGREIRRRPELWPGWWAGFE